MIPYDICLCLTVSLFFFFGKSYFWNKNTVSALRMSRARPVGNPVCQALYLPVPSFTDSCPGPLCCQLWRIFSPSSLKLLNPPIASEDKLWVTQTPQACPGISTKDKSVHLCSAWPEQLTKFHTFKAEANFLVKQVPVLKGWILSLEVRKMIKASSELQDI